MVVVRPNFTHNYDFHSSTHNYYLYSKSGLTSTIIPPIVAICEVETKDIMYQTSGKFVQEPWPPTSFFQCFDLGVLSRSHILTRNKNRTKESKLKLSQLIPLLAPCILVGQGRVVVLVGVINAPYLILSLIIQPKMETTLQSSKDHTRC